jgi:poly(A) polymerase
MRIARERIDPDAEKVVRRLSRHGHQAYLVGGCVRDLLLNRTPKDFDVATSATPKEIKQLFRNCRIIGRRFRLAHIFFGGKVIETSTFRANPRRGDDESGELFIHRDNVFGTDTEDAQRRDFTINGLFYDVEAERVIDHVGGIPDLESRVVATIGNPDIRFQEDPVRMLRAIKFAARLDFSISPESYAAILHRRGEIRKCAQPRVIEELYRLLRGGAARRSFELLVETQLISTLSAQLAAMFSARTLEAEAGSKNDRSRGPGRFSFIADEAELEARRNVAWRMLDELDTLCKNNEEVTNALVLSTLLSPFVMPTILAAEVSPLAANEAVEEILVPLCMELQIARRDAERTRQILLAQRRLLPSRRRRDKPMSLVRRDYFEETLRIYELLGRASGREDAEDVEYWRHLQAQGAIADSHKRSGKRRRRRRGGRRRRRALSHPDVNDESSQGSGRPFQEIH